MRKNREGGGLALGCLKELKPVWLREGNDDVEALSIEIVVKDMKVRCVVAYGCQENSSRVRVRTWGGTKFAEIVLPPLKTESP